MKLKTIFSLLIFLLTSGYLVAQTSSDSTQINPKPKNADDPASFLTRLEVFNEFQHYDKAGGFGVNQTTLRTILKIGKRFTTRFDVPLVSNTIPNAQGYASFGLGDISIRLLGYKIKESPRSALTASVEFQFNSAVSPILGTGKNLLIPVVTYSTLLKGNKNLFYILLQQTNSVGGDKNRADLSFTKVQSAILHFWNKKLWTVFGGELFIDYKKEAATSMILKCRLTGAPSSRINLWVQGNGGLYGDFVGRYQWGAEAGVRYFLLRSMNLTKARLTKESNVK